MRVPGRWILGVGVVIVLAGAVVTVAQQDSASPLPDNPLQGRLLFESKKCNQCHGVAGNRIF